MKINIRVCFILFFAGQLFAQSPGWVVFDGKQESCVKQVTVSGERVSIQPSVDGLKVEIQNNSGEYPGITVIPLSGTSTWDLSAYGGVEAKIRNVGEGNLKMVVRVDDDGDWRDNPWNAEAAEIKPREIAMVKVIFGKSFGYQPSHNLKSQAIKRILVFTGRVDKGAAFCVEEIKATGTPAQRGIDLNQLRTNPAGGVLFPPKDTVDSAKQFATTGGAKSSWDGKGMVILFEGGKSSSFLYKPLSGFWNLSDYTEVRVRVKNVGNVPARSSACIESKRKETMTAVSKSPILPGGEEEIIIPISPSPVWLGSNSFEGMTVKREEGTGSEFESARAAGVRIISDASSGEKKLQLVSIVCTSSSISLPSWIGKRPPVEGDWVKTFEEDFTGSFLNLKRWNIYTANYWDKKSHFSKDNVMVRDGKLVLKFEKKTGFHNDNPLDTQTGETPYATGFADTFGKWTQKYGYFEARIKPPRVPGIWSAFWLMPDRGIHYKGDRSDTGNGGMEFDIWEHLTLYGPYRYNIAMHWDGYGKEHKTSGTDCIYALPDKEGFITCGLLWMPGLAVYYANGKEVLRWESSSVSQVPSYMIFDLISGGWDHEPLDDSKLPEELIVDYVRVWQRKDLVSDEDGSKPNDGGPSAPVLPKGKSE